MRAPPISEARRPFTCLPGDPPGKIHVLADHKVRRADDVVGQIFAWSLTLSSTSTTGWIDVCLFSMVGGSTTVN
jgi:hypothetical protein